jgi:Cu-Zn family superoxide dismutase
MKTILATLILTAALATAARADKITVEMYLVTDQGVGERIGTITVEDTPYGAVFTPQLAKLPPRHTRLSRARARQVRLRR